MLWPENLDNPEKLAFPDYRDYQIRRQGSLVAGCDGTRSAPSVLHFIPLWLQLALSNRAKLHFGQEESINSTLFTEAGNNTLELINHTLELISYWTAEVDFLLI